jgi:hypothetical protein
MQINHLQRLVSNSGAQALRLAAAALRTSQSALGAYQGQACYEERYRKRVPRQLSQRANKLGMQLVAVAQPV